MKRIRINVSKPYDVIIEKGSTDHIAEYIRPVCKTNRTAIITDDVVNAAYGDAISGHIKAAGFETSKYIMKNGESSKNITTLSNILEFLAGNHLRRNDTLIALGGGVVGDIAGLAASLYMRGINVIQIPTTLLSMVDSSAGGKTAVNLINGKNLAGTFWHPSAVICDPDIAEHLPDSIFAQGMAEVIKCNVIKDLPIIEYVLESSVKTRLQEIIEVCITLKRDIVEKDEFDEKGIRNLLNVGHTIAHAIEKMSNYSISHGIAVGTGLVIEAKIAEKLGLCKHDTVSRIFSAVDTYGLFYNIPWSKNSLVSTMKNDKKNRDAKITFELPHYLGFCEEYKLSCDELLKLL